MYFELHMEFVWPTLVRLLSLPGALTHNKDAASEREIACWFDLLSHLAVPKAPQSVALAVRTDSLEG